MTCLLLSSDHLSTRDDVREAFVSHARDVTGVFEFFYRGGSLDALALIPSQDFAAWQHVLVGSAEG